MTFADYEKDANHIALEFVQYYFNKLSSNCSKLYQLYFDDAVLKHMDHKSVPFDSVYNEYHNLDQIKKYWRSLTCLEQCKCVLLNVTALHNNDGTLVITVAGEILLKEDYENEEKIVPTKAFTQTFILQNQDRRDHYLIKSDILVFLPNIDYVDNETAEVLLEHVPSEDEKAAVVNGSAKGVEPTEKTQQEVVEQTNGTTIAEDKAIVKPSDSKDTKDAKKQITIAAATSNAGAAKSNQEAPVSKKEVKAPVPVSTMTASVSTATTADITPSSAKPLANTPPSHTQTTKTSVKASSTAPTNPTQTASASSIPESKPSLSSASTPASTTVISPKPSVAASSPVPAPAPAPTAALSVAPLVAEAGAKPKPKLAPASAPANSIPWALALKANKSSQSSSSLMASSLSQSKANPPSTSASPQQQTTQKFTTTPSTVSTQITAGKQLI
jgi:hypothetical protein